MSDIHIGTTVDEHLNFGTGSLDFHKIIEILPENINITIETVKNSKTNLKDFYNDVKYVRGLPWQR